jgi:hypothetical protein
VVAAKLVTADDVPIRVTWAGGGPPVLDPEWAEVAEAVGRHFDDWHRGLGDPTAEVPPALAGPAHASRASE